MIETTTGLAMAKVDTHSLDFTNKRQQQRVVKVQEFFANFDHVYYGAKDSAATELMHKAKL